LAIQHEINVVKANVVDFLSRETVVSKMIIAYNRRKLGLEYLRRTFAPLLQAVVERDELNLEVHPLLIYNAMVNDVETGEKSSLERDNISEDQIAQLPEVQKIVKERLAEIERLAQQVCVYLEFLNQPFIILL